VQRRDRYARVKPSAVPDLSVCTGCAGQGLGDGGAGREGQLGRYTAIETAGCARVSMVECLDQCGRGDVVVVRPVPEHQASTRPAWLAGLTGPDVSDALHGWLAAGGPGSSDLPAALVPLVIQPTS